MIKIHLDLKLITVQIEFCLYVNYFAFLKWSNKSIECGRLLLKPRFAFKCQVRFFIDLKLGELVMAMLS